MSLDEPAVESHDAQHRNPTPPNNLRWILRIGDSISVSCMWLSGAAMGLIILICGINVVRRYVLGSVWSWAEEAMLFLMIVVVFLGAVTVTWNGAHLSLDMLVNRLQPSFRAVVLWLGVTVAVITLCVCSVVSFQVVKLLYDYNQKSQALELPLWMPQGLICLGFGLMAAMAVLRAVLVRASREELPIQ